MRHSHVIASLAAPAKSAAVDIPNASNMILRLKENITLS